MIEKLAVWGLFGNHGSLGYIEFRNMFVIVG